MQPHQGYQYYKETLMFSRDTITAVHCKSVGQIAEGIEPLDTEGSIKSTLNQVEFGYCIHDSGGTSRKEQTISRGIGISVVYFETTLVNY